MLINFITFYTCKYFLIDIELPSVPIPIPKPKYTITNNYIISENPNKLIPILFNNAESAIAFVIKL